MRGPVFHKERGAALLIVLILAATASAIALALVDDLTFAVRRTGNLSAREQARWYAVGAEPLAAAILEADYRATPEADTKESPWFQQQNQFPIDGGMIVADLRDDTACFNINALVRQTSVGVYAANPDAFDAYALLLASLEIDRSVQGALIDAAIDWMDSDEDRGASGAESNHYRREEPPREAANQPLQEVGELRAVRGYDLEVYSTLAPYLCAHSPGELTPINVNVLTEEDAPIVRMLSDGRLDLRPAAEIAAATPVSGWASSVAFWDALRANSNTDWSDLQPADPKTFAGEGTGVPAATVSGYYRLTTRITYYDAYLEAEAAIRMNGGRAQLLWRRLGADG